MARSTWGSKREIRPGVWELRYKVQGKRTSSTFKGTSRQADAELASLRVKYESASDKPDGSMSIICFFDTVFIVECRHRVKDGSMSARTVRGYEEACNASIRRSSIADIPLCNLRPTKVQKWLDPMTNGKAKKALSLLRNMMRRAQAKEYIESHPMDNRFLIPKRQSGLARTKEIYTAAELEEIFRECEGEIWEPGFIWAAFGGGQRAEVLGIKPEEVEFESMENEKGQSILFAIAPILRGVHIIDGELTILDHAKNEIREEPLLIEEPFSLRMWAIVRQRLEAGDTWLMDDGFGFPMKPESMTGSYKRWLAKSRHPYIPFGNLRNAYSTRLHAKNVDDDMRHKLMRHSTNSEIDYRNYFRPHLEEKMRAILETT